ncbi:MAG: 4-hydroxy-3-methylbut-2-enyl diphosphate reductase, partial [Coriobacteriia bacterium]|nr:4-hydroxy-3-methylbut-2-enyl diphosphate reductase [Coriobacteriia bacterium]
VGEQGHPEVEGISAYSGDQVVVVLDASELPVFSPNTKIGIVAQTTQTAEAFNAIVDAVKALGIDPLVHDTVCNASRQRQEAALELAAEVDVMLVIGGRNSSNTTRLAELCARVCERTFHVEKPAELDPAWFNGASSIGLSAGASTPESQLVEFEQELERYFSREQCL